MKEDILNILKDYMTERQIELALPRLVNLISVNVPVSGILPSDEEVGIELVARYAGKTSRGTSIAREGFADGVIWVINEIKKRGNLR